MIISIAHDEGKVGVSARASGRGKIRGMCAISCANLYLLSFFP